MSTVYLVSIVVESPCSGIIERAVVVSEERGHAMKVKEEFEQVTGLKVAVQPIEIWAGVEYLRKELEKFAYVQCAMCNIKVLETEVEWWGDPICPECALPLNESYLKYVDEHGTGEEETYDVR